MAYQRFQFPICRTGTYGSFCKRDPLLMGAGPAREVNCGTCIEEDHIPAGPFDILKDIPAILGLAEGTNRGDFLLNGESIPLLYADPIGSDPLLADLMVKNAEKVLSDL